jgi:hypothetical protein
MKINGLHYDTFGENPIDRFDLEQKIMEAWNICNDLKLLYKASERMDEDQMMSALDGLQIFAEMRFNDLWDTFEKCIANGAFNARVEEQQEEDSIVLFDPDTGHTMDVDMEFVLHENP